MLVLTRKMDEMIQIGDSIVIKVIATGRGKVKLGIEAPSSVRVLRGELSPLAQQFARPAKARDTTEIEVGHVVAH
jgi:carbon storage regulator